MNRDRESALHRSSRRGPYSQPLTDALHSIQPLRLQRTAKRLKGWPMILTRQSALHRFSRRGPRSQPLTGALHSIQPLRLQRTAR